MRKVSVMSGSIRRVWRLILKELLISFGNPKTRLVLIFPPIMQLIIFASAVTLDVKNVRTGVYNMDSGVEAAAFLKAFSTKPIFKELRYYRGHDEIKRALENREIFAAIIVPEDFSQKVLAQGETAQIQLLLDGRRANAANILGGYVSTIVQTYGVDVEVAKSGGSIERIAPGVVPRRWFNPNLSAHNAFMPCLVCLLATTVGMIVSSQSIARERETGTFEQLLVSPASPVEIVLGKTISAVFLATISALMITAIVIWGFRTPLQGSFWTVLATLVLFLTSIISIGLMISALSTTQQQATLGMFLFLPPAIMLSGFATPIENMPSWLQTFTLLNPVRYEMSLMRGLFLRDMSINSIIPCVVPLIIIAFLSFSAACYMFKRRME